MKNKLEFTKSKFGHSNLQQC